MGRRIVLPTITHEWPQTEYRIVGPADILGAFVSNADEDGVYLQNRLGQRFVVGLNGDPIVEYWEASNGVL